MNSGDLKTYKYVKILELNFFTITILSLHLMRSESQKIKKNQERNKNYARKWCMKYLVKKKTKH